MAENLPPFDNPYDSSIVYVRLLFGVFLWQIFAHRLFEVAERPLNFIQSPVQWDKEWIPCFSIRKHCCAPTRDFWCSRDAIDVLRRTVNVAQLT